MKKVFVSVGISLDGFLAGVNGGPNNPLGDNGAEIHEWIYIQKSFRELLELGEGGETGKNNDIINRTGASIMGKRMFEEGEANWPEKSQGIKTSEFQEALMLFNNISMRGLLTSLQFIVHP